MMRKTGPGKTTLFASLTIKSNDMKLECPKPEQFTDIPKPTCDEGNMLAKAQIAGREIWRQRIHRAIMRKLENNIPVPEFKKPDWMNE